MSKCWKCGQEETTGHFNGNCAASYAQETDIDFDLTPLKQQIAALQTQLRQESARLRAADIAAEYARCGESFAAAGRPADGPVADMFSRAEAEYSQMADAIWFAKWEKWQREEWERIFR